MKKPNFFIVGAPKCGTTAMNNYLSQHPDIYMATKELHHFGSDLPTKTKISESEYLEHFAAARHEKIVGESSVWYLYSSKAAAEIKSFSPDAKILIMLRHPVSMMYALHSQHLYDANEDVTDFGLAISLDNERKAGKKLPDAVEFHALPPYRDVVSYAKQVQRYLDVFGSENVHIILYENFTADTARTVRETLQFLGVDQNFQLSYPRINPNKKIRFFRLHTLVKNPSGILRSVVQVLIPVKKWRHHIMKAIFKRNVSYSPRPTMSDALYQQLTLEMKPQVAALEQVLKRDLSAWK